RPRVPRHGAVFPQGEVRTGGGPKTPCASQGRKSARAQHTHPLRPCHAKSACASQGASRVVRTGPLAQASSLVPSRLAGTSEDACATTPATLYGFASSAFQASYSFSTCS